MRVLGEGQLSLSKVLMATEAELDLKNFGALFRHVIARCDFRTDFHILSNISLDTLDYTGPEINKGSKAIFLGLGPARFPLEAKAPTSFSNARFGAAQVFCPGVLVVKGPAYTGENNDAEQLLAQPEIKGFRMVILHDDPAAACENDQAFLWHVFTRFEPAGDIYGVREIKRNHLAFEAPLVIDCRMKPGYPGVLEVDPETKKAADHLMENVPELSRIKPVV